ncbi:hypothetical protein D3C80_2188920 [compost metagenome]
MLSRRLLRKGFQVILTEDGRQGVELAAAWKPDAMILIPSLWSWSGCSAKFINRWPVKDAKQCLYIIL